MQCLTEKNIIELVKIEQKITLDIAIQSKKNYVYRRENEELALRTISGILLMFSDYFNTSNQLTETQSVLTASLFLEQYPAESIEDLILCLKKAKVGEYGKIYNRIDGGLIFEWFNRYLSEKYERFEQIKQNEKFDYQSNATLELPESTLNIIKEIAIAKAVHPSPLSSSLETINDKKHFELFQKNISIFDKTQLLKLKEDYLSMNNKTMFSNFDHYIELIDKELDTN